MISWCWTFEQSKMNDPRVQKLKSQIEITLLTAIFVVSILGLTPTS